MEDPDLDTAAAGPAFMYVELGAAHGLSREALMRAAGLDERLREDPDARVPMVAYMILWRELLVGLPHVAVPVEAMRALDFSAMGVVGHILLRADDIAQVAVLNERFSRLADTAVKLHWLSRGELVGYSISHRPEVVALGFPIEVMLGWGFRLMCHAAGETVPLHEVTFAHPAGYPVEAYQALFHAPVRFGAGESALWFDRATLHRPLARRDPLIRRYLEAHGAQLLAAYPVPEPSPVAQIREAILIELAISGAELARVARRVAMSTRTVQRRLEEHGASYHNLVDDVRATMARALLADRARSIIDVAFELGYADLKGFYRAFRRWTGTTPADWRATRGTAP